MNFRILCCIVLGVFTAHLGLFMFLMHLRPQPKFVTPPKPNFTATSQTFVDRKTGEKTTYREITVSTKFADLPPRRTQASAGSEHLPQVSLGRGELPVARAHE